MESKNNGNIGLFGVIIGVVVVVLSVVVVAMINCGRGEDACQEVNWVG